MVVGTKQLHARRIYMNYLFIIIVQLKNQLKHKIAFRLRRKTIFIVLQTKCIRIFSFGKMQLVTLSKESASFAVRR